MQIDLILLVCSSQFYFLVNDFIFVVKDEQTSRIRSNSIPTHSQLTLAIYLLTNLYLAISFGLILSFSRTINYLYKCSSQFHQLAISLNIGN